MTRTRRNFAPSELRYMELHYPHRSTRDIAHALRRSVDVILNKAMELGLHKSDEYLTQRTPAKPRISSAVPQKKRGRYRPIGSTRVNGDGRLERKVSDMRGTRNDCWRPVHRLVWEAAHGPVPEGCIVLFKAGRATTDESKITLDALECISRAALLVKRNSVNLRYPKPVVDLIYAKASLTRAINRKARAHGRTAK